MSPPPADDTLTEIDALLQERNEARFARDYDAADDIRDDLKRRYNVHVYDKFREYEIVERRDRGGGGRGGGGGGYGDRGGQMKQPQWDFGPLGHDYERAPDDNADLTEGFLEEVNDLIRRR